MKFVRGFRLTEKFLYTFVFSLFITILAHAGESPIVRAVPSSVDDLHPAGSWCIRKLYDLAPKPRITGSKDEIKQKKKDLRKELAIIRKEKKKTVTLNVMEITKMVSRLRAKFEEHPDQEVAWYEDLAMRMRDYTYSFEEVFAAVIMLSPRAEAAWENLLVARGTKDNPQPVSMLVSSKSHSYAFISQLPFFKFTADRAYSSRRLMGIFRTQKFDLPQMLPADKPGETPEFIRFMLSMADALEKASSTSGRLSSEFARQFWPLSSIVNIWPFSTLINRALDAHAFTMLGYESTKLAVNKGLKLFGFKGWTDDKVLRNFGIRFFNYDLDRRNLLLKMAWYLEDPTRFATAPPKLDQAEAIILEQQGPEALVEEMLVQKGNQETMHFLTSFIPFLFAAGDYIDFLIKGAAVPQFDDTPAENAACRTPEQTEEYAFSPNPESNVLPSPFLDAFIGKRIDQGHLGEDNPCDPKDSKHPHGKVAAFEEELRNKYPNQEDLDKAKRNMTTLPYEVLAAPGEINKLLMEIKGVYHKDMLQAQAAEKRGEVFDPENKSCMKYLVYYFCKNPFPF